MGDGERHGRCLSDLWWRWAGKRPQPAPLGARHGPSIPPPTPRLHAPPARPRSKVNTAERTGAPLAARWARHGGGGAGLSCEWPGPAPGYHSMVSVRTGRYGRCRQVGSPGGRERSTPGSGDPGGERGNTHTHTHKVFVSAPGVVLVFHLAVPVGPTSRGGAIQPVPTRAKPCY